MKAKLLLALVATLLGTSLVSEATVIVYKGTGRILRGNSLTAKPVATTLFFVVDFNTLEGRWVFAQTVNGLKSIFDDGARSYGIAEVNTTTARTVTYATTSFAYVNPTSFSFFSVRLAGKKANVFLTAGAPVPATIGKSMAGSYSFTEGTPHVVDGPVAVSVDLKRTQFSNGNNLTVAQAAAAIINEYVPGKGYANVVPIP